MGARRDELEQGEVEEGLCEKQKKRKGKKKKKEKET